MTESIKLCPECGHAWRLHVGGHECAGTFYEGGTVCRCTAADCCSTPELHAVHLASTRPIPMPRQP
jgi:hypothetical protein